MVLLLAMALGLAGQAVSPEAAQHIRAGMEAKQQGRLQDAIKEFKVVTELAPDVAAAFVNLGAANLENHDYGGAIPPLKRALELNPDLIGAHQMLGYALLAQGYAAEALPDLEKAGLPDAIGIADLKLGKLPEAVANLQAALAKRPNDPDLLYYLGRASGLLSKQTFDILQSAYPDSARAHQALGENLAVLKRVPEAEKEYREALRLRPDTPGIHLALGGLYAAASQWPQAEEEFRGEAKIQPGDAETAYRLGSAYLETGKAAEAVRELQRADQLRPGMPETLYALGKALAANGDAGGAERAWKSLLAIEKQGELAAQAHFGLAGLYRKGGKAAEAARETQEFQRLRNGATQK
ncbi:MAG: tetratricopeptide repeat protein [Acidobacteriaceae bacterium]|nr:tetratricopeptide repeat protein [Acidobacteriaceae bacterium]